MSREKRITPQAAGTTGGAIEERNRKRLVFDFSTSLVSQSMSWWRKIANDLGNGTDCFASCVRVWLAQPTGL